MAAGSCPCSTFVFTNDSRNGDHAVGTSDHGASRWRGVRCRKSTLATIGSDWCMYISVSLGPTRAGLELCVCGLDWPLAADGIITSEYWGFDEEPRTRNSCASKRNLRRMFYCRCDLARKDIPPARSRVLADLCGCRRSDFEFL